MSDQEAEKKTAEEEATKKKLEELNARLWIVQLVRDPEQGVTNVMPLQNVEKQWQLDLMVDQAKAQAELTKISRSLIGLLTNMGVIKAKGKGLFKGK